MVLVLVLQSTPCVLWRLIGEEKLRKTLKEEGWG